MKYKQRKQYYQLDVVFKETVIVEVVNTLDLYNFFFTEQNAQNK